MTIAFPLGGFPWLLKSENTGGDGGCLPGKIGSLDTHSPAAGVDDGVDLYHVGG